MAQENDEVAEYEDNPNIRSTPESEKIRQVLGDVYSAVRSGEINKTIASFTFDHYLDEAKRKIKEARVLRSASDPGKGVGTRPSQLTALEKLEDTFKKVYSKAESIAKDVEDNS